MILTDTPAASEGRGVQGTEEAEEKAETGLG